jgi:hypothetical protein
MYQTLSSRMKHDKCSKSRKLCVELLEHRQMLSASKIAFTGEIHIGEKDWRQPDIDQTIAASTSWNQTHHAQYPAAQSGGSYASASGTITPFSVESHGKLFLNWIGPPWNDLGWPHVYHTQNFTPLLDVPAGTHYTVMVSWKFTMTNSSENPEHYWSKPSDPFNNYWSGSDTLPRGDRIVYQGVTGGTPTTVDGKPLYKVEGFGNTGMISQNGSLWGPKTHTGSMTIDVSVQVRIDEGEIPNVDIAVPGRVLSGEPLRLDAFAWDPDEGSLPNGVGITYYSWEIISPSGIRYLYEGVDEDVIVDTFSELGSYSVALTVHDNEGMSRTAHSKFDVEADVALTAIDASDPLHPTLIIKAYGDFTSSVLTIAGSPQIIGPLSSGINHVQVTLEPIYNRLATRGTGVQAVVLTAFTDRGDAFTATTTFNATPFVSVNRGHWDVVPGYDAGPLSVMKVFATVHGNAWLWGLPYVNASPVTQVLRSALVTMSASFPQSPPERIFQSAVAVSHGGASVQMTQLTPDQPRMGNYFQQFSLLGSAFQRFVRSGEELAFDVFGFTHFTFSDRRQWVILPSVDRARLTVEIP